MTSFRKCLYAVLILQTMRAENLSQNITGPVSAGGDDSVRQVQLAIRKLQDWYNPQTGLWIKTGWWNSANALTVLIDFSKATHTSQFESVVARTYEANVRGGFLNQYYDDEGWWALAWIDAYDLTHNPAYLGTAATIFDDMTHGWDGTCGGGLWWSKRRHYKNAIANELFLSVAAHLADHFGDQPKRKEYVAWAEREWNWFRHSGMIERDGLISDGLNSQCKDNHGRKWSYNQGVILGGLAELSLIRGERGTLREARRIVGAAISTLVNSDGILRDPCEPKCNGDATQFKGIFMRNLALLNERVPNAQYAQFILRNAESILANDQGPSHSFGVGWSGPPGTANPSTQSSAIDALVAAIQVRTPRGLQ